MLWDLARGTELALLKIGLAWHSTFDVSGDLLTNGQAGVWRWPIRLSPRSGDLRIGTPRELPLRGTACGISEDQTGRIVAVAAHGAANVAVGDRLLTIGPLDDCRGVAVSPDGQWLATGSNAVEGVIIWKLPEGSRSTTLPTAAPTYASFTPDGKWLMTEMSPSRLYEVGTWSEVRRYEGSFRCFSPDGQQAIVLDTSRVLNLVEIETGRTLAQFEGPDLNNDGMGMAAFSPDGARLVVVSNTAPPCVHVWDLRAIRRQLAEMGLDWDQPVYPSLPPVDTELHVIRYDERLAEARALCAGPVGKGRSRL